MQNNWKKYEKKTVKSVSMKYPFSTIVYPPLSFESMYQLCVKHYYRTLSLFENHIWSHLQTQNNGLRDEILLFQYRLNNNEDISFLFVLFKLLLPL